MNFHSLARVVVDFGAGDSGDEEEVLLGLQRLCAARCCGTHLLLQEMDRLCLDLQGRYQLSR